jgi:predicted DNA-binding transcriptional regulator YafY
MPYALKLFRQRWYIVGRPLDKDKILIFATDRISTLKLEDQTFKYPTDFDINHYYQDSFGIIIEDGLACEHIVIKVANSQVKYLRSLPLHHSQQETTITPEYSIFEYDLKPTYDFEQEIMSHLDDFEVQKPLSLRTRIKTIVNNLSNIYQDRY